MTIYYNFFNFFLFKSQCYPCRRLCIVSNRPFPEYHHNACLEEKFTKRIEAFLHLLRVKWTCVVLILVQYTCTRHLHSLLHTMAEAQQEREIWAMLVFLCLWRLQFTRWHATLLWFYTSFHTIAIFSYWNTSKNSPGELCANTRHDHLYISMQY